MFVGRLPACRLEFRLVHTGTVLGAAHCLMLPDWLTSYGFWSSLLTTLLLPPASLLLAALAGLLILRRRPSLGWLLLLLGLVALWAVSTPFVGYMLLASTGETKPFDGATVKYFKPEDRPQIIVVLGAGRAMGAREYEGESLRDHSLARVRYGARLQRETGLPLMTVGGKAEGGILSQGNLMKGALEYEFGVPVRLVENESTSTLEAARMSSDILKTAGFSRILLVTDYWHMRRARAAFKQYGMSVTPAPMGYRELNVHDPAEWLPDTSGLVMSRLALRELTGSLFYQMHAVFFPPQGS